ncbi:hypothetical protein PflCFBP13517_26440 [Pseudomonas fluorescens]|nr:hypothetical protein PflCFBP13517_26440 [Pseudomonas fluorescens]
MGSSLDKKEVPDPLGWEPQGRKVVSVIAAAMSVRGMDTGRTSGLTQQAARRHWNPGRLED